MEETDGVLYVEGSSDYDLLKEWARVLDHPAKITLDDVCVHQINGRHPRDARAHFFAIKAVRGNSKALLILDGDNRNLPEHEILTDGLTITRWTRYEVESYLLHPPALSRFVSGPVPDLFSEQRFNAGMEYLRDELPPAVIKDPLGNHDYLNSTPASKTILPGYFSAAGIDISKNEYYQIAAQMEPTEIPNEIRDKLDLIHHVLGDLASRTSKI